MEATVRQAISPGNVGRKSGAHRPAWTLKATSESANPLYSTHSPFQNSLACPIPSRPFLPKSSDFLPASPGFPAYIRSPGRLQTPGQPRFHAACPPRRRPCRNHRPPHSFQIPREGHKSRSRAGDLPPPGRQRLVGRWPARQSSWAVIGSKYALAASESSGVSMPSFI